MIRLALIALLFAILVLSYPLSNLYTEWQWLTELKQPRVFTTTVGAKLTLFFGFGILFFLIAYFNFWLAQKLNAGRARPRMVDLERANLSRMARQASGVLAVAAAAGLAVLSGIAASHRWSDYLLFTHAGTFGVNDPVFGQDVGFFVFRLPFLSFLLNWLIFTLAVTAIGSALIHYSDGALDFLANSVPTFAPYVRKHLLALVGVLALVFACNYMLARYNVLYSDNGPFFGAGYTDLHARLPALTFQMIFMAVTGILCIANIWYGRPFRLPLVGLAAWMIVTLGGGGLYPWFLQRFTVVPNQYNREKAYIARDIEFTRRAYGLDRIKEQPFTGADPLTASVLSANRASIENIRLWDWPQLALVYTAKQAVQTYYRFVLPTATSRTAYDYNIDVDRYQVNNRPRQVILAPRELVIDALPAQAQTWQNQRLQYTHGYGAVASPVNEVDSDGLPRYFVSDVPVQSRVPSMKVARPQIYFGELASNYAFVHTRQVEFDYPAKEGIRSTEYAGTGGVPLSSTLSRALWSLRLGDTNMLLSSDLTPKSRILYRRNIRDRVAALAPFLEWDYDPYMVIHEGKLVWLLDAYTTTHRYPYSQPTIMPAARGQLASRFNYIRNAVKATVDAYDGTVTLYVADSTDPIIKVWSRIFPGLLIPLDQMPASLREHVRYPEDLFRIQREVLTTYHMSDPAVYYRKDDAWEIPSSSAPGNNDERRFSGPVQDAIDPYYMIMRLPGESEDKFVLMTPFSPLNRPNIAAWMSAKCDPSEYGELLLYRFPKTTPVNGPQQIMAQINAQNDIARHISLLDQRGSRVSFGNLLAIPIQSSLLYAVPLYVQASATSAPTPEINQVILATGDRIVMRPTLDEAVAALGEGTAAVSEGQPAGPGRPTPAAPSTQSGAPASTPELIRRANEAYRRARQQQQEYNRTLDELGRALEGLQKGSGR